MAFTPSTRVHLIDTPLDNTYKNTIHFDDIGDQHEYFFNHVVHTFEGVTYQRKDNSISVREHIDNLWNVNYVAYQNANFNMKWFYAFINKMEYVNDNLTKIYIETDVFQTWLFDVQLMPSFVVREHVADDTIGKHLVDEQLECGEYKMPVYEASGELGANWNILAVSDNSPLGNSDPIGNLYGGLVTGFTYFPFPNTAAGITWLKDTIDAYIDAGKADAIIMIFTVPQLAVPSITNNGGNWTLGQPITTSEPYGFHTFTKSKRLSTIDGYTPRNNKMQVYPYKFLYASNNNGHSATFRYEDFPSADMGFMVTSALMPNPTVMLSPTSYKGADLSYEHSLMLQGFPQCSWNTDMYAAWIAQNTGAMAVTLAGSAAAIIGGALTGNVLAMGGGALAVANQLTQIYQASIQPDQAKGNVGGASLMYSTNALDFHFVHMEIKAEYAKRIDDFLTMYGYKVNTLKVPETRSRLNWNYIQTIDINIRGAIPDDDMTRLKRAYNEGITLWHTTVNFLDYSQPNTIINESILAPTLQTAVTNTMGTLITLTFDKAMVNPTGKENQFTVNVDGSNRNASLLALTQSNKYGLALTTPILQQQTVTVTYTPGDIVSSDGGILATFTTNVTNNVPTTPELISALTNTEGTIITITFSEPMTYPAGQYSQFVVLADVVQKTISGGSLDADPTKLNLTLASALTVGQSVTISYVPGTIQSANGAALPAFNNIEVINNVATPYQEWANFPTTPDLTATFPYQCVGYAGSTPTYYLFVSSQPMYYNGTTIYPNNGTYFKHYRLVSGSWSLYHAVYYSYPNSGIVECNNDVFSDGANTIVYLAKTTP